MERAGFYQGVPLPRLIDESRQSLDFSRTRTNQWAIDLFEGGLQVLGELAGPASGSAAPTTWSEEEYLRQLGAHQNNQVACIYQVLKTFSLLVLGRHRQALALPDETEPMIHTVATQGLLPWPEHAFTRLLLATLHSSVQAQCQAAWRSEIGRIAVQLGVWVERCPQT